MAVRKLSSLLFAALVVAACSSAGGDERTTATTTRRATSSSSTTSTSTTTSISTTTTTLPPTTAAPTTAAPSPPPPPPPPPAPRLAIEQGYTPFGTVGGVTLFHPSARVELIGFHESNHDGAQYIDPLASAVFPTTLESRERDTNRHGAADIVVDPDLEIRAPVTGRVKRAGGYTLYCDHRDDFAVIEPDEHPGWEVKILHIVGVQVRAGDRVVAGETLIAPRPHQLPFESQVDEVTADPAWPHVHVEVVDPSIPDRPTPGGGC